MDAQVGVFIVLEGADGSGKTTQFRLLAERLKAVGHDVQVIKFPRYEEPSSHFVRQYLQGKYGPSDSVSPYTASVFYALDRYEAASDILQALKEGKVVLSDRYAGANMAHQGAKFTNISEQRGFFLWAEGLEYHQLGIPRPNLNIYLRMPAPISRQLINRRSQVSGAKLDEHEKSADHIEKAIGAYDLLCSLFPKDFRAIECAKNGEILSVIEINDLIWEAIRPLLPPPKHPGKGSVLKLDTSVATNKGGAKEQEPTAVGSILQNKSEPLLADTAVDKQPFKLVKVVPRNEFELLLHKFGSPDLDKWPYSKKRQILSQELPHLLSAASYQFTGGTGMGKRLTLSAKQLQVMRTSSPRRFRELTDLVAEAHPLLGDYLKEHYLKASHEPTSKSTKNHKKLDPAS